MSSRRYYYTLIASLPYLPRFERAERLPINRDRLADRLRMLDPDDAGLVRRVGAFFGAGQQPVAQSREEIEADLLWMEEQMRRPFLRAVFEFPIEQRMVMAALRRRRLGLPEPGEHDRWGVGPLVPHIRRHWDVPDFKLGPMVPWIHKARAHLEAGETVALERLLMGLLWDRMDRLTQGHEFEFEAVLAYLFKWDALNQWLSRDRENAKARFEEILLESIGEHKQFFAPAGTES